METKPETMTPPFTVFHESLCHGCAAPKYVESAKGSVFVLCPLLPQKYPRQPVVSCAFFRPRGTTTQ